MKVPWKNISNQPCELFIHGVNIIFNSKHENEWMLEYDI